MMWMTKVRCFSFIAAISTAIASMSLNLDVEIKIRHYLKMKSQYFSKGSFKIMSMTLSKSVGGT